MSNSGIGQGIPKRLGKVGPNAMKKVKAQDRGQQLATPVDRASLPPEQGGMNPADSGWIKRYLDLSDQAYPADEEEEELRSKQQKAG